MLRFCSKVLVVDDTQLQRAMLEHFLVKAGYDVKLASSGEMALELYSSYKPDIILLDVVMEGINGFETAIELRKLTQNNYLPIIYLTAQAVDHRNHPYLCILREILFF